MEQNLVPRFNTIKARAAETYVVLFNCCVVYQERNKLRHFNIFSRVMFFPLGFCVQLPWKRGRGEFVEMIEGPHSVGLP